MYDETKAVPILDLHYRACQHANRQFCRINASFQPFANLPPCVTSPYIKNDQAIKELFFSDISYATYICTYCCNFKPLDYFLKPPGPRVNNDNNLTRQGH